jgi:hypothetical protein
MEERYQKIRSSVTRFIAFQIGLSTFKWDVKAMKYKYEAFSFYVWPNSQIKDQTMMFQVSGPHLRKFRA